MNIDQKTLYEPPRPVSGGMVDWLTATTQSQSMGMLWLEKFNDSRQEENQVRSAGVKGFKGMKSGEMSWMYRGYDQRYMLIARSATANRMWPAMVGPKSQVSRVDWAVDVTLDPRQPGLPGEMYRVLGKVANRWKTAVILNSDLGQTLYTGSRSSDMYGRLYDKGVQMGKLQPGEYYRYEVEIKGQRAREAVGRMQEFETDTDRLPSWISSNVKEFFSRRFVPVAFEADPDLEDWRSVYVRQTDARKRLTWLRTQVKPSVEWLFEIGLGADVLYNLGIDSGTCTKFALRVKQPSSIKNHTKGG